ncbi:SMI1/KNR4 family protein [Chitinophaga sancti]|uniref:SMI1/KNR4 family protein n=1 Tax=Chitinophaga sancti TaxID=1004 RepID=UPI002A750924|nr:SMI1/KNR4 family protein [Chitinophaga sancti]WPQ66409.1 SMI1/KNR4 family protein [Chitinophaga sancti]
MKYQYLGFVADYYQTTKSNEKTIKKLETGFGAPFPEAFRELIRIVGPSAAFNIVAFSDGSYDGMQALHDMARENAEEDGTDFMKDKNQFPFSGSGVTGQFWFFRLDEGDDPPVYQYSPPQEGKDPYRKLADHLSVYLKTFLRFSK